jgi:N-acetylmuramoyl-L-alanine amidase
MARQLLSALFLLVLTTGTAVATNLPFVEQKKTGTTFRINNHFPTQDVFTLIKPERLVVDQKISSHTLQALRQWKQAHLRLAGVKTIRIGPQPKKEARLVIEIKDNWPVHFKRYKNYTEFRITRPQTEPLSRLQQAATPIKLQPVGPSKQQRRQQKKRLTVVLDPGHGGKDPGATGHRGTHEKHVVLKIAKKLAAILNASPRYRAILTRSTDRYIPLRQRLRIARRYHADLFVSIHADAFRNTKARGSSVYALSQRGATSEAARWLAQNENASELMGGVDLDNKSKLLRSVLINLSQTASVRDSLNVGSHILSSLNQVNRLHHRRVEQAAFVVLKSPDIPSLLIETGFLSNRYEEKLLNSPTQQKRIAQAIFKGINKYFKVYKRRAI